MSSRSVDKVALEQFEDKQEGEKLVVGDSLDLIKNVPVKIEAQLGEAEISVEELMSLKDGSIVKLNTGSTDRVAMYLNGEVIGFGELVVVEDSLAIRITEVRS